MTLHFTTYAIVIRRYTGHCPQEKHSHGETFGNSTGHWYNSYRQRILSNSNERLGRGGHSIIPFPAYYQNEPSLVVGSTQRSHRRWEASEKYQLHNLSSNESRIGAFKLASRLNFFFRPRFRSRLSIHFLHSTPRHKMQHVFGGMIWP